MSDEKKTMSELIEEDLENFKRDKKRQQDVLNAVHKNDPEINMKALYTKKPRRGCFG